MAATDCWLMLACMRIPLPFVHWLEMPPLQTAPSEQAITWGEGTIVLKITRTKSRSRYTVPLNPLDYGKGSG